MKECPILFGGAMVRAILAGTKTQTRRVINPQPIEVVDGIPYRSQYDSVAKRAVGRKVHRSAYGKRGDRLWVRETHYCMGKWVRDGKTATGRQRWRFAADAEGVVYTDNLITTPNTRTTRGWHKRPAIFMPRWASRITLEVTGVRVERLQDIGADDAIAEGLSCLSKDGGRMFKYGIPDRDGEPGEDDQGWHWHRWRQSPIDAYQVLWDSINAKRAPWASNPFVWVITFKRIGL